MKLYVPGNHDYPVWSSWHQGDGKLTEAKLLVDEALEFGSFNFYGSPWTANCGMAFPSYWDEIQSKWQAIPEDTDVLITHMPPHRILDGNISTENLGCPELRKRALEIEPKLHIFGHAHASHGTKKIGNTVFINASQCCGQEPSRTVEYFL